MMVLGVKVDAEVLSANCFLKTQAGDTWTLSVNKGKVVATFESETELDAWWDALEKASPRPELEPRSCKLSNHVVILGVKVDAEVLNARHFRKTRDANVWTLSLSTGKVVATFGSETELDAWWDALEKASPRPELEPRSYTKMESPCYTTSNEVEILGVKVAGHVLNARQFRKTQVNGEWVLSLRNHVKPIAFFESEAELDNWLNAFEESVPRNASKKRSCLKSDYLIILGIKVKYSFLNSLHFRKTRQENVWLLTVRKGKVVAAFNSEFELDNWFSVLKEVAQDFEGRSRLRLSLDGSFGNIKKSKSNNNKGRGGRLDGEQSIPMLPTEFDASNLQDWDLT